MKIVITFILMMSSAVLYAQQAADTLRLYQQSCTKQEQAILAKYGTTLATRMADLKKKGDLDGFLLLQAEEKRFQEEKRVAAPKEANEAFRPLAEAHFQEITTLLEKYIKALDGLIKSETAADRIESAKAVKAEKDKAVSILADIQKKSPASAGATNKIRKDEDKSVVLPQSQKTNVLAPSNGELQIKAYIDGSDTLKIKGDRAWWVHHADALPGKHSGNNYPTYLGNAEWLPEWEGNESKEYVGVKPMLRAEALANVTIKAKKARGKAVITEKPSKDNDCTLSVKFDDAYGAADWYIVTLRWRY